MGLYKGPFISLSVADLPLNISTQKIFHCAKKYGFDGVEVLPGFKLYPHVNKISKNAKLYSIKVLSIHHQFSFGKVWISSENCFSLARKLNATIVVHPLKKYSLNDSLQQKYLKEMRRLSKEFSVPVSLENMGNESSIPLYKFISHSHPHTRNLEMLYKIVKRYEFNATFDTSHADMTAPHLNDSFKKLYPHIDNIHLSDYTLEKKHLGLGKGQLEVENFLQYLKKNNYKGKITLELSPRLYCKEKDYFKEIKDSASIIRNVFTGA